MWFAGSSIPQLRKIIAVPILKPGKDPNSHESYRPISLMSAILKTYERMIKNRLEYWLAIKTVLPQNQFGFRKFYSTIDAISMLVTDIQICMSSNRYTAAAFLDIKGAYDTVNLCIGKQIDACWSTNNIFESYYVLV